MRRGEVWWINFTDGVGGEVRNTRPAVIVSNDTSNHHSNRVQVVPLSSKTNKLYPFEALVTIESGKSKAMADQIATISKIRLTKYLGSLSPLEIQGVEAAVRIQVGLSI